MKYYTVAEIAVTDRAWVRDYVTNVTTMVERAGGRYLARTTRIEKLEGDRPAPPLCLLIEWPSKEAAEAFYSSDEYAPYKRMRLAGARNEMMLVAGDDVNRSANLRP